VDGGGHIFLGGIGQVSAAFSRHLEEAHPRLPLPGLFQGMAPEMGRSIIFWKEPLVLLSSEIDVP
jgi:hypothetical protein